MAPHTSWQHYTTPGMCLAAFTMVQHRTDRRWPSKHAGGSGHHTHANNWVGSNYGFPDDAEETRWANEQLHATDSIVPVHSAPQAVDTFSTAAVVTARACLDHLPLTVAQTPSPSLPDFVTLALILHDDTLLQASLDRQVALAGTPVARAAVLRAAVEAELHAPPPRLDLATTTLAHLDALGAPARVARFYCYLALALYYRGQGDDRGDGMATDTLIALSQRFAPHELAQGILRDDALRPYKWRMARTQHDGGVQSPAYQTAHLEYLAFVTQLVAQGLFDQGWFARHGETP